MLISFIIPTFHSENFIERCLLSIRRLMKQWDLSSDEFEIVLIDDTHHEGPATIRNRGLEKACGEWIWFVDGDDEVGSLTLDDSKKMLNALLSRDIEMIAFNYEEVYAGKSVMVKKYADEKTLDGVTLIKEEKGGSYLWNKVFRRTAIGDTRFINGIFHIEDMCFNLHAIINMRKILCMPLSVYLYHRDNCCSISHAISLRSRVMANEDSLKVYLSLKKLADSLDGKKKEVIYEKLNFDVIAHLYTIFRFDNSRTFRRFQDEYRGMGLIPVRRTHNLKADLFAMLINLLSLF